MSLFGYQNLYSCSSTSSGTSSDTVTNPASADLNMNSYDILNAGNVLTNPLQTNLDNQGFDVVNVGEIEFADSESANVIKFSKGGTEYAELNYDRSTDGLYFDGSLINSASNDNVHNPMTSDLDANEHPIYKSGQIKVGGFGYYNNPPTGDPPLELNTNATIVSCRGLNFYGSNNSIHRDGDELTWGNQIVPTYSNKALNLPDSSDNAHLMSYSSVTGGMQIDGIHTMGLRKVGQADESVLMLDKKMNDLQSLAFNESGVDKLLTANSDGVLMWNGTAVNNGSSSGVHNPMTEALNANNHDLDGVKEITFNGNSAALTMQVNDNVPQLYWNSHLVGSGSSSGVHNPMDSNLNANEKQITNLDSLGFQDGSVLDVISNTVNGTTTAELTFDGDVVHKSSYTGDKSVALTLKYDTIPVSGTSYVLCVGEYVTPSFGDFEYKFDLSVTCTVAIAEWYPRLYAMETESNTVPSGSIEIVNLTGGKWMTGNDGKTKSLTFTINSQGASGGLTGTWNKTLLQGFNYIGLSVFGSNEASGPLGATGVSCTLHRTVSTGGALTLSNQVALSGAESGDLMVGGKVVSTLNSVEFGSSDVNHDVASYAIDTNTAGILSGYAFSNKGSGFKFESYVQNDNDSLTISGKQLHTFANPNSHTFDLVASDTNIVFQVEGEADARWKAKWFYDSMVYVSPPQVNPDISGYTHWWQLIDDVSNSVAGGEPWTHIGVENYESGGGLILGSTSRAQITGGSNMPNITQNEDWTMMFWVKVSTAAGQNQVLMQSTSDGSTSNGIRISQRYHGGQPNSEFEVNLYSADSLKNSTGVVDPASVGYLFGDEWRHLALRFEASSQTLDFVIDGVQNDGRVEATSSTLVDYPYTSNGLIELNPDQSWVGSIKHLRFYPSKLTDNDIGVIRTFTA